MAIAGKDSRFALLKIDDDFDSEDKKSHSKPTQNKGSQQSNAKKKNRKKKKAEQQKVETDELRNLAFGGAKAANIVKPGPGNQGGGDQPPPEKQWQEWKKTDKEFVTETYEKDLQQALLLSKLDFEENKEVLSAVKDTDAGGKGGSAKKKKKKDKPAPMSLQEFKELPEGETNENGHSAEDDSGPQKPSTTVTDPDPKFFDKVKEDAHKIIRKEQIQEEYRKQYVVENARTAHYQEEIRKRDEEIERLKGESSSSEKELKQVKKRNQQLCHILAQGEMKDKTAVLLELEELKQVRDELTSEVTSLTSELEKERSKVHSLKGDLDKVKGGKYGK